MGHFKRIGFLVFILATIACNRTQNGEGKDRGIHFSTGETKLEKPVSLLFFDGNYHLFYEFTTNQKASMLGHAKSSDLLNWQELPLKIDSDQKYVVGNGSLLYDFSNSSGLEMEGFPLIGIFPVSSENEPEAENQEQSLQILFSEDEGDHWEEFTSGLIKLDNFYSPITNVKVTWGEKTQKWVMLILSGYEISFYLSDDLIHWEFASRFGDEVFAKEGEWTKLDFFPLDVKETNESKWVLLVSGDSGSPNQGSGIQYFTGDFDGYVFKADRDKPKWLDNGSDNYSGIVLSDYLLNATNPVFLGSICNLKYRRQGDTENSANELTIPRMLSLSNGYNGLSILSTPLEQLASLESETEQLKETHFSGEVKIKKTFKIPVEINLTINGNDRLYLDMATVFGIKLSNNAGDQLVIGYHNQRAYFFILDPIKNSEEIEDLKGFDYGPYVSNKQPIDLKIIVDKNSIELFAMNGLISLTRKYSFRENPLEITLYTEEGNITLNEGSICPLKSIIQGEDILH